MILSYRERVIVAIILVFLPTFGEITGPERTREADKISNSVCLPDNPRKIFGLTSDAYSSHE